MDTLKCYEVLELPPQAPPADVRDAYVKLLQIWNPDRYEHWAMKAKAKERMVEIEEAYHHLASFIPELRHGSTAKSAAAAHSADETDSALVDDTSSHTQWTLMVFLALLFGFAGLVGYHVWKTEYAVQKNEAPPPSEENLTPSAASTPS